VSNGFGFGPNDPEENEPKNINPFGNMQFNEIFKQFSGLGLDIQSLMASLTGQGNVARLSKDVIRDISRKFLAAQGERPVGVSELNEIREAFAIADLWMDGATTFPSLGIPENCAMGRREWIDSSIAGWQEIATPLIEGMSTGITNALSSQLPSQEDLDQAARELGSSNMGFSSMGFSMPPIGNIAAIMSTLMGSMISSQLGQTIGSLATTVTGANDVSLPLTNPVRMYLIPENVVRWGEGLDIPAQEVRIYLALREIAAARLFAHTPWLNSYLRTAIEMYGKGIRIDFSSMQRQAEDAMNSGDFDPTNPESIQRALTGGMFTPEESDAQRSSLAKLEMVLALIDGWIDQVVVDASGNRLPSMVKLRETQARRRATHSPTQQLFASLIGLEVSPRTARECASFWRTIGETQSETHRDKLWEDAVLLPREEDLADPLKFLKSTIVPDDLSGLV
jgi:putative hydrolase